jgi:hypothetical protein
MAEPENPMPTFLRRIDAKLEVVRADVSDLKERVTALELGQAKLAEAVAHLAEAAARINARLDRIDLRLDRIERRLDLVEGPLPT